MWNVCVILSFVLFLLGVIFVIRKSRKKQTGEKTFIIKIILFLFAADTALFWPIVWETFVADAAWLRITKTIFVSMHQALRLFVVDNDFEIIKDSVPQTERLLYPFYTVYAAILYLLSPIFTFSFVFSFLKNASALRKLTFQYKKNLMIFSDFNEESVTLAIDAHNKRTGETIVFTAVPEDDSTCSLLKEKAKNINAIMLFKDVLSVDFLKTHDQKSTIKFLLLGEDESKNLSKALAIISKYKARPNTELYVLSNNSGGELMLNAAVAKAEEALAQQSGNKTDKQEITIKIRKISHIQKTVFSVLQNSGEKIFDEAKTLSKYEDKRIGAVVVGLGKYGSEMTRALAWFGQMEGYRLTIDAFDQKSNAFDLLAGSCPELMDAKHNYNFDDYGEARYGITVHAGMDVNAASFEDAIKKLKNATFVFVTLGDDAKNVQAAVRLRMLFDRMGIHPRIQAIVVDLEQKNALGDIANEKGTKYDVDFVGSVDDVFSYKSIFNDELADKALQRHLAWSNPDTLVEDTKKFWKYNYNYSSSMASALHREMKEKCKISAVLKKKEDRTPEETLSLRKMEHRRWNAYMRSQGYVYAPVRNDLAKTHPCLVTFDKLPLKEQEKDDD